MILNIKDFEENDRIIQLKIDEKKVFYIPFDDSKKKSIDKLFTIMQSDNKMYLKNEKQSFFS